MMEYSGLNCTTAAIPVPQEKRVPIAELIQAQADALLKAEGNINEILRWLDRGSEQQDEPLPDPSDMRAAVQINLEASHRIENKVDLIRAILGG